MRLVGNLPYNISTPLLFHLLGFGALIKDLHVMLQREVVDRMTAAPGGKEYGRVDLHPGDTETLTLDLAAGTYTLYCSLLGHEDAGMRTDITVR